MLLDKGSKALPVRDFMATSLLIVGDRLTIPGLPLPLEPQIQGIAADVEHLAHCGLSFPSLHRFNRFLTKVITVGS